MSDPYDPNLTDPGFTIPGYVDVRIIGRGGFSTVYFAMQTQFERVVAVKVLDIGLEDERTRRQYQRECAATGRLSGHPNIVSIIESGFTSLRKPYLTMDYCSRGSLADRIAVFGPLPVSEVLRIGVKIAGALESAHQKGILHRDIKPENILVSGYGEPALADFGIASVAAKLESSVTMPALSPNHAPPEVMESKKATERSDVYSLGSTLYQLLAGRPAFNLDDDPSLLALLLRVLQAPVPPIGRQDVPPALQELLMTAMAKDPAARYQSAGAMGVALQHLQADLGYPVTELVTFAPVPGALSVTAVGEPGGRNGGAGTGSDGAGKASSRPTVPPAPTPTPVPPPPADAHAVTGTAMVDRGSSATMIGAGSPPPRSRRAGSSTLLRVAVIGFVLVLLAGGGYVGWRGISGTNGTTPGDGGSGPTVASVPSGQSGPDSTVAARSKVLFIRGGSGTGGLASGSDDQLSDIGDMSGQARNHGFGHLATMLRGEGFEVTQRTEGPASHPAPVDLIAENLDQYAVVVFASNNQTYTTEMAEAVGDYVRKGGGVLFMSDANWGRDFRQAPDSDQTLLSQFDLQLAQDHNLYAVDQTSYVVPDHPILEGVASFGGEGVSPFTVTDKVPGVDPQIVVRVPPEVTVQRNDGLPGKVTPSTPADATLVVVEVGQGRVAGTFDRDTFFNPGPAGSSLDTLDHRKYASNLFAWLAHRR